MCVCVAGPGEGVTVGTTASNELVIGMSQHTSVESGTAARRGTEGRYRLELNTDQRCKQSLTVQFPPLSKHTASP